MIGSTRKVVVYASPEPCDMRKGYDGLFALARDVIRQDPGLSSRTYQVAGHTDSEKLQGGQFKDNWGLSVMRARQVVVFLVDPAKDAGGLKPKNWSASGYGEEDPVATNDTNGTDDSSTCSHAISFSLGTVISCAPLSFLK